MTKAAAERNATISSLIHQVDQYFRMDNPVHRTHYLALRETYGELAAIMLVSQDAAHAANAARILGVPEDTLARHGQGLELTDPGAIASHPGWKARNRVVRHGETAHYFIVNPEAETKVGGRITGMFTREQTVPVYAQPE